MVKAILFIAIGLILSANVSVGATQFYSSVSVVTCRNVVDNKTPVDVDSVFTQGDDVKVLVGFKDVFGKHRIMVEKYLNGYFFAQSTTVWRNEEEKWVWESSFYTISQDNARPGRWKFIIRFGDREGGFGEAIEANFRVARTDPIYTFTGAVACLGIADGEIKDSKIPIGADSVFTAGDTVRGLVELIKVYIRHRFGVVTLFNGQYWSEYISDWREVGFGWDYSHFTPELKNARVGGWEFLIYLESEGRLDFLTDIRFRVEEANPTAIKEDGNFPLPFSLSQNFPNPFNPATTISFNLPQNGDACLEVFNLSGQKVAVLADGYLEAGLHQASWNAAGLSAGIYFAKLRSGNFSATTKMTLLK